MDQWHQGYALAVFHMTASHHGRLVVKPGDVTDAWWRGYQHALATVR